MRRAGQEVDGPGSVMLSACLSSASVALCIPPFRDLGGSDCPAGVRAASLAQVMCQPWSSRTRRLDLQLMPRDRRRSSR